MAFLPRITPLPLPILIRRCLMSLVFKRIYRYSGYKRAQFYSEVQKSFSDYIYMEVGFPSGYPTIGLYPANGMSTQNWSNLQIYKYVNTSFEPNFVTYGCVPFWDPHLKCLSM